MNELVVYGFTNRSGAAALQDIGVRTKSRGGPHGVSLIEVGNVSAIVGPQTKWKVFRSAEFNNLTRLQHYQCVLENVMEDTVILPARFQTILPGREAVAGLLAQHGHRLAKPIHDYGHLIEIEVIIEWDLNDIVQTILTKDGLDPGQVDGTSHGMATELQRSVGIRRDALALYIRKALQAISIDISDVRDPSANVVSRHVLLLEKERDTDLFMLLREIDKSGVGKLRMRCVGPLPPCSFASVDVWVGDHEMVENARVNLNLNPIVEKGEIRKAYHTAIKRLHPDLNEVVGGNVEEINAIRDSYELLSMIAEGQVFGGNASKVDPEKRLEKAMVRLDRGALDQTFMISVRREGSRKAVA
jgi:gas vesicle protein GvpL/GvpF